MVSRNVAGTKFRETFTEMNLENSYKVEDDLTKRIDYYDQKLEQVFGDKFDVFNGYVNIKTEYPRLKQVKIIKTRKMDHIQSKIDIDYYRKLIRKTVINDEGEKRKYYNTKNKTIKSMIQPEDIKDRSLYYGSLRLNSNFNDSKMNSNRNIIQIIKPIDESEEIGIRQNSNSGSKGNSNKNLIDRSRLCFRPSEIKPLTSTYSLNVYDDETAINNNSKRVTFFPQQSDMISNTMSRNSKLGINSIGIDLPRISKNTVESFVETPKTVKDPKETTNHNGSLFTMFLGKTQNTERNTERNTKRNTERKTKFNFFNTADNLSSNSVSNSNRPNSFMNSISKKKVIESYVSPTHSLKRTANISDS